MKPGRPPRTMSIRRWLALALVSLFLAPLLTLAVIGFIVFRDQQGPRDLQDVIESRLVTDVDQWEDPAWQAAIRDEFAADGADVVLLSGGEEIFRTSENPLDGTQSSTRLVRSIDVPESDPPRQAYIYTHESIGPPEELREWFVPVALITALIMTLAAIGWFLGRSIIVPLTATSDAAHQVARGELDIALPTSRVREVADLNQAFESMSDALRSSLHQQAKMDGERKLFISAVAHDLRTPLFSLRGSLEGLEQGIANTPEKRARYIAVAQDKANALERLIADLFAFTRMEYLEDAPNRAPLDLTSFLPRLVDGIRPQADQAAIRLTLDTASTSGEVSADHHMLTRVMENLLDNALRHTPQGGTVQVALRDAGPNVEILVQDSGPGIAAEDMPHLFTPLYRGESSRNRKTAGAGLGLTIARQIMVAHGGDLVAGNTPSGGAVLTATLPRSVNSNGTTRTE